jgi:mRNA interferase RelE/StbE
MYELKFHQEVQKDLDRLDNNIRKLFAKKLRQILQNPDIGKDLGNKNNLGLAGLKKVYFDNKRYRIVYKVEQEEIIVYVIAVGKRDNMQVYKKANERVEK